MFSKICFLFLSLFCLFISLLISLCPTAVSFKLSTDFRQTFEKKKIIKSPFLLVPFRVVNCHSLLFCASHSWFCASISLFAVSAIQFSACIRLLFLFYLSYPVSAISVVLFLVLQIIQYDLFSIHLPRAPPFYPLFIPLIVPSLSFLFSLCLSVLGPCVKVDTVAHSV